MMARRVLMLCYHYPPVQSAGTARSVAFSALLPGFGWEPTVLTVRTARDRWSARHGRPPDGVEVVRTPEWDLTGLTEFLHGATCRLLRSSRLEPDRNHYREILGFPDPQVAWLTTLSGARLARRRDLVYASCSPYSSALSALAIGRLARRPVVVDLRDAWCYDLAGTRSRWYIRAIAALERRVVERCDRLVVNTEGAYRLYAERYPRHATKMVTVPNGYDRLPSDVMIDRTRFRVVHVGTLYGGRDPRPLLGALRRLGDPRVEFVHVGEPYPGLEAAARPVEARQLGVVSRAEALRVMQSASLLYLRQGPSNRIAVAAKTYEYLATGLPILCHCPEGDNADLVRRYAVNGAVVTADGEKPLADAVAAVLQRWSDLRPQVHLEFAARYSRAALTARLAEVFDGACRDAREEVRP